MLWGPSSIYVAQLHCHCGCHKTTESGLPRIQFLLWSENSECIDLEKLIFCENDSPRILQQVKIIKKKKKTSGEKFNAAHWKLKRFIWDERCFFFTRKWTEFMLTSIFYDTSLMQKHRYHYFAKFLYKIFLHVKKFFFYMNVKKNCRIHRHLMSINIFLFN